ncbi:beta-galactosidase [Paenibacillus sp. UNCCL117]|uniref:beta-galactosidase n=1 Tax=unclassified Paenibacillus TaxID=185978 RepID=UPI00089189FC|nr:MULTISPECIES: beta-galactosidase [unclassified Paenibacillus]SDC63857.1 beta-galactosidase [Paenibacillus sp. cl123]SFW22397.1 beta-galactosidase [Paenibacillus sp. UNCCL117]
MIHPKLPAIWYGGDYNPDQWPEEIWQEDMRLFRQAGINVVTLPVFSWAKLQPAEDTYTFGWLDRIMDLVAGNGIYVCLATSTAAQPAWMSRRYPDVLPVDIDGRRRTHGSRVNFCPTSPSYRKYAVRLAGKLAERYGRHPALVIWHVGNEYGPHCYCDRCAAEFRVWLKARYGTIEELNKRWNMSFWGHTVYEWDEIVPPTNLNGDNRCFQSMTLDYKRFMSDAILACYQAEHDVIKRATPELKVTTNIWGLFNGLDLQRWADRMDIVSWDSYPQMNEPMNQVAMRHDYMRGLKQGAPFMLMEQTPSQQNWQPYNSLKRPGIMRLWSYQAIARGADTVMFFQLRRSFGACEKYHGAVIEHAGHGNTRVFRECAQLGAELQQLGDTLIDSRHRHEAALLFDIDTWNAVEITSGPNVDLDYAAQAQKYYKAFYDLNVGLDVISPLSDFSGYKLVVAPVLYMLKPGVAERIEAFVKAGGIFVTTFFSGIVNENDLVTLGGYPGELRQLLGIWVEEIDSLPPDLSNRIVVSEPFGSVAGEYGCGMLCDLLHLEGARALAAYGDDFYAGMPALTENSYGQGRAYYVATDADERFLADFVRTLCDNAGLQAPLAADAGVELTQRHKAGKRYTFALNHNPRPAGVSMGDGCRDLLTGRVFTAGERVELEAHGVLILEEWD